MAIRTTKAASKALSYATEDDAMDLRKLKTLIELVESSGIAELEIEEGEERVRITRSVAASPVSTVVVPTAMPNSATLPPAALAPPRPHRLKRKAIR